VKFIDQWVFYLTKVGIKKDEKACPLKHSMVGNHTMLAA